MATGKARRTRKSRAGCRNCKLRKVKCDEATPWCRKCEVYGVVCNYERTVPDLQAASEKGGQWRVESLDGGSYEDTDVSPTRPPSPPISVSLTTPLVSADDTSSVCIDAPSAEFLTLFRVCSTMTLGGAKMQEIYESHIMYLAFSSPLLMHAALALASSHGRYLRNPRLTKPSPTEIYHWAQCTALFNNKLNSPIQPQDRDLLWAVAINLGVIEFASLEASNPEEAWPMRTEPDPSDLRWVRLGAGKAAMWRETKPLRPDSVFRALAPEYSALHTPLPTSGAGDVPPVLRALCGIDEASTAENNPYYTAVQALARLASQPQDKGSPVTSLAFITHVAPAYAALLERKDAVALLLLALWYAGAGRRVWWIERRAEVEGRSICLYLERYHWYEEAIMEVLPWRSPARFDGAFMMPKVFDDWGPVVEAGQLSV